MTIIKNKLTQMILVGLLFAFILGILSYLVRNSIFTNKISYEKQIVIVDVYYKNKISEYLNKLNQIGYLNRNLVFSQELFTSIKYIKLRYQRDKKLSAGCYNLSMNLTDESIFLETNSYPLQNREHMNRCLSNLFELSYNRLKEKLDLYNYREISLLNFELDAETSVLNNTNDENEQNLKSEVEKKDIEFTKEICSDLDRITKGFNLNADDKTRNNDSDNIGLNFLSLFNLHQSFIALKTLEQICDNSFKYTTSKKREFIFHLNALKNLIEETEFDEVFKVEKITEVIDESNQYLSTKNIVLTFSIFGFIFGVLLVYNFGSLKDKNE